MNNEEAQAGAEASMDVWGEAFMRMVRERLSIRITVGASQGELRVDLLDCDASGEVRLISSDSVTLRLSTPPPPSPPPPPSVWWGK